MMHYVREGTHIHQVFTPYAEFQDTTHGTTQFTRVQQRRSDPDISQDCSCSSETCCRSNRYVVLLLHTLPTGVALCTNCTNSAGNEATRRRLTPPSRYGTAVRSQLQF
ncbi:hypothetical protein BsWGS_16682 [Bradybaena similaris]